MHRFTQHVRSRFRDVADSIRFMPEQTKRYIYYGVLGSTSLATTGLYVSFHTTGIDWFAAQLQMYQFKMPMPVSMNVVQRLENTMRDMKLDETWPIDLFSFVGNDIYSIGCLRLSSGAYIGVPFNYSFKSPSEVKPSDLRLMGRFKTKRSKDSLVFKQLSESLVLSDQAQQYAMAHEINLLRSNYFFIKSANILACTAASVSLARFVSRRISRQSSNSMMLRFLGTFACLCMGFLTALITDQMVDEVYDLQAVKQTLHELGPEYCVGANEYYQKLIERNKALFELLGEHGPKFCSEEGATRKLFGYRSITYQSHLALLSK